MQREGKWTREPVGPAPRRRRSGALVLTAAALALARAAHAQPDLAAERDPRELEAKALCLGGEVDAAVVLLEKLHVERGDPLFLYNQARCYQRNGLRKAAIARFREYLRLGHAASAEERAEAEGHLAALEREERREANLASSPAVVAVTPAPTPPAPARPASGLTRRPLALAAGATGLVLLGAGGFFGLRVRSLEAEAESLARAERRVDPEAERRGKGAARWQWVGYGAGASALAAAAVLYLWPSRPDRAWAIAPLAGAGPMGGLVRRTF